MKLFIILTIIVCLSWCSSGIRINCNKPPPLNEDHIFTCCKHPDGHNDITEACAKETGFKLPGETFEAMVDITADQAMEGTCFGKCVFLKLNFLKKNTTELDIEAVRKYFQTKNADDPEYAKEMINAFDHCHGKSEESVSKFFANPIFKHMSHKFCEPTSSVILACVIREFFHNCPDDRWDKSTICEETLAYSRSCNDSLTTL
ncbi:Odorant-binding protein 58c [Drosophila willistoni]|uniref:GK21845 n=1 Tax=Drosophila willistoni TaxID=7260 RepID=B4MQB7_DROWI|nr:uncharacterized protein LOC6640171 [Drosophila willistoni]XP_046866070.1 uncharacterized protein LOC6640171 [Drosophila willistoni]EDW74306.1 Odorant-binding protein 58c [Drosophila willistoni]